MRDTKAGRELRGVSVETDGANGVSSESLIAPTNA
jgi:hypothetical protein